MGTAPLSPVAYTAAYQQEPSGPVESERAGFAMPHALVLIVFIIAAVVLAAVGMAVEDVLFLLGGVGAIGALVLLVATSGRSGGRFGRALDALDTYRRSGR
jgi:hypothetical protein